MTCAKDIQMVMQIIHILDTISFDIFKVGDSTTLRGRMECASGDREVP
jgi:hypothetical protein